MLVKHVPGHASDIWGSEFRVSVLFQASELIVYSDLKRGTSSERTAKHPGPVLVRSQRKNWLHVQLAVCQWSC